MTVLRLRAGTATVLGVVLGLTGALAAAALVAVARPAVRATGARLHGLGTRLDLVCS